MRILLLALTAAAVQISLAQAAGPYDGKWTGGYSHGYPGGCSNYSGDISFDVVNGSLEHGAATSSITGQAAITGTISADGKLNATSNVAQIEGAATGSKLKGTLSTSRCKFVVELDRS